MAGGQRALLATCFLLAGGCAGSNAASRGSEPDGEFLAEIWTARWQLAEGILATLEISAAAITIGSAIGLGVGVGLCFAP